MNDNSVVDYIIKKWFPILGVLFIVGGFSYLLYDGVWQNVSESVRVMLGFIGGILFIAGGYTFEEKLRGFGDVVIGGGILIMYVTLIFGSRLSTVEFASIPEAMALLVALAFSLAIAFYAYERKSKVILVLGALGGYLTPFFMGGEYLSYISSGQGIGLNIFLIYFLAVSASVFFVAQKMFLKGIGLLNSLGLFIGTISLTAVMSRDFKSNIGFLTIFAVAVMVLHIAAMAVNAKKFDGEKDPFLVSGYILPLLWFIIFVSSFISQYLVKLEVAGIFTAVSVLYFGAWYYLRDTTESDRHFTLYVGGIISLVIAIFNVIPSALEFSGLILTLISLIFAGLFYGKGLVQREFSAIIFALGGVLFNFGHLGKMGFLELGFLSGASVSVILTLIPFIILTPTSRLIKHKGEANTFRRFLGYLSYILVILILASNILDVVDIPMSFIFLVIPSLILLIVGIQEKEYANKNKYFNWATALGMFGFMDSLFTILNRFYPAPEWLKPFSTPESLIGLSVLGILYFVVKNYIEFDAGEQGYQGTPFLVTFSFYLTLWSVVTHEVLGFFNLIGFDFSNPSYQGIRAFFITLLWAGLALYMLFTAEDKNERNKKNIGFALLAATILKLVFYDLANVNTNLKVFLFILIGAAIMYVSYSANKKDEKKLN